MPETVLGIKNLMMEQNPATGKVPEDLDGGLAF
jgi:hypothetical protein